ncbi:MAG: PAS domain S-box protein, partial [Pontiella sp.]|nr:PAS domain S-box protein [Pontiella sp.]
MMKKKIPGFLITSNRVCLIAGIMSLPLASQAQIEFKTPVPIEMNVFSYLIIGFLLVLSVMMFFLFQHRYNHARRELKDITAELGTTRDRLTDTGKKLDETQKNLKDVSKRYQGILYEANVGMFQMDLAGRCSFINTALQEMSGLYPKKALKEGLLSAVHPEDHAAFKSVWDAFVKHGETFDLIFRFQQDKADDVYVLCHANKVYNSRKEVDSYIGWVTDITRFHDQELLQKAATARYAHFVSETVEAFYKLEPANPIPLTTEPAKMAESIMDGMVLAECNDTFAAMYGAKPEELIGKPINALKDGCGPFRNNASIKSFIEEGFRSVDLESNRQDPSGNRLNLLNHVVGLIEDEQLIGIWGSQRNISQQKREKAELTSQVSFMHRILSALPADVHVKDTRCRYLYASEKLAKRTGIPQEDWIGKTIFEVMPGTPRDHDKMAIETMKSGTLKRSESPYDTAGQSGWMETVQIPLISDEALVEGVVGLSLDVTDRKNQEEEVRRDRDRVEAQLEHTKGELADSRTEYGKTAEALSEAVQKLKIAEAEKVNSEHEFTKKLEERKAAEETLRRHEESLLTRQRQLEEELSNRLKDLELETDKRKKWEELLDIREYELRKAEEHLAQISAQFDKESRLRENIESQLDAAKADTEKYHKELTALSANRDQTEKQLSKTEELLKKTQEQLRQMSEKHTADLEKEVAEHKAAAEKLIQTMEELDDFRHQFGERLDQETKAIKQELARKQITEKTLRQHEKDLQKRIKELDDSLKQKTKEFTDQIKVLEKADGKRKELEQTLESVDQRQQERIARETEKLTLQISEIKLEEVKLRKQLNELNDKNTLLEETLKQRDKELEKAHKDT